MLAYKDTGKEPVFQGNERFIWPAVRRDIDEAQSAQEAAAEQSRENGKKGGRPRKPPEENPPGFSETQETIRTKDKDIDKGHCQGQGSAGEARHGAAYGRRPAAREKNKMATDAERAVEHRRNAGSLDKFLLELRRELAEQEERAGAP